MNKYGIRDIVLNNPEEEQEPLVVAAIWEDTNKPLTFDEIYDINEDREFVASLLN